MYGCPLLQLLKYGIPCYGFWSSNVWLPPVTAFKVWYSLLRLLKCGVTAFEVWLPPVIAFEVWLPHVIAFEVWLPPVTAFEVWLPPVTAFEVWLSPVTAFEVWLPSLTAFEVWLPHVTAFEVWLPPVIAFEVWLPPVTAFEEWLPSFTVLVAQLLSVAVLGVSLPPPHYSPPPPVLSSFLFPVFRCNDDVWPSGVAVSGDWSQQETRRPSGAALRAGPPAVPASGQLGGPAGGRCPASPHVRPPVRLHARLRGLLTWSRTVTSHTRLRTLRAPLSGTFLQTLPDLVTPLISAQLSTDAVSALRKVWVLIRLWKQPSVCEPVWRSGKVLGW